MFRPTRFAILMATEPGKAHAKLCKLYEKLKTIDAVARELDVERHTVGRWIKRLLNAGYRDPRTPAPTSDDQTSSQDK